MNFFLFYSFYFSLFSQLPDWLEFDDGMIDESIYRIVTDVRVEGSHQHQGFVKKLADPVTIGFDTNDAVLGEGI